MNVRRQAQDILYRVLYQNGYAGLLLRYQKGQETEHQGLLTELVYGTLRNLTYLEYQWQDLVSRRVRPRTAILLDLSIYQLFFMQAVPDYAVIHEAVETADPAERGFVNAVLRQVQRRGRRPAAGRDVLRKTALETSHPEWLLRLWAAHYGEETAIAIARHDQTPAPLYGRVNPLKAEADLLQGDAKAEDLGGGCFRYRGALAQTSWFREGKVLIQDRASQQLVPYLQVQPGQRVLDACAAPGTKTQQIAVLMQNQGQIIANDLHASRVQLIEQLMARTGVSNVATTCRDASVLQTEWLEPGFERVYLDVPCSGLGDLRRKPEIRYRVQPEELDTLVQLQEEILAACCRYLRPAGILVYSTCTLNRKENEQQIRHFLQEHEEFSLLQEKTCLPMELDSDGFYVAALRKQGR